MSKAETIALNIIENYGENALRELVAMLEANVNGEKIAKHFGVTRQAVNRWKMALGVQTRTWVPAPWMAELGIGDNE